MNTKEFFCAKFSWFRGLFCLCLYLSDVVLDAFVLVPFLENLLLSCNEKEFTGACSTIGDYVCTALQYEKTGLFSEFWFDTAAECPVPVVEGVLPGVYNGTSREFALSEEFSVLSFDGFSLGGIFCMGLVNVSFDSKFGSFSGHSVGNCTLVRERKAHDACAGDFNFTADEFLQGNVCAASEWVLYRVFAAVCASSLVTVFVISVYAAVTKRYGTTTLQLLVERTLIGIGLYGVDKDAYEDRINTVSDKGRLNLLDDAVFLCEVIVDATNVVLAIFLISPLYDSAEAADPFLIKFFEGEESESSLYISDVELELALLLSVVTSLGTLSVIIIFHVYMRLRVLFGNGRLALAVVLVICTAGYIVVFAFLGFLRSFRNVLVIACFVLTVGLAGYVFRKDMKEEQEKSLTPK